MNRLHRWGAFQVASSLLFWGLFPAVANGQPTDLKVALTAQKVVVTEGKEKLVPADKARPGDVIQYDASYQNSGTAPLHNVGAIVPIPAGLVLVAETAKPAAPEASLDGKTFQQTPLTRPVINAAGIAENQAVPLSEYRALRWTLAEVPAGGVHNCYGARTRCDQRTEAKVSRLSLSYLSRPEWRRACQLGRRVLRFFPTIALAAGLAYAAAPPANTSIGNQASATYTDASNTQRTVTSNTVVTIVQQVASFTLTTDGQSKPAAPGGQVVFPHTLTNTGNGNDTFNLSVVANGGGAFTLTNVSLYADSNGDGIPDNSTPITSTGVLAAGATFKFVAVAIVPTGQTAGQTASLTASAVGTATGTPAAQQNNTDNVTVTSDAVVNVTKAISAATGAAGSGPYTFTLTYTNTGNNTAVNFTLTDAIPAGMTYVAGSGRWSITGSGVTLTDANDGPQGTLPDTITYDFGQTVAGRVTAVISRVQPGESRTLTFDVTIQGTQAAGIIDNTANYSYDPGTGTPTVNFPTNTVSFRVTQGAGVSITGATVPTAVQGATVSFTNIVTNTGNGPDSFDITVSNTSFPAGTSFHLFKSDGLTPLVDTNGNSTPDTGPLPVGGTYSVVLQAILPPAASGTNVNYTANKVATSFANSAVSANADDVLTTVTASTVDLTNTRSIAGGADAADGLGLGPEGTPRLTNTINAGSTTRFVLFVNNTGTAGDSYDLSASSVANFATGLPGGWTIVFTDTGGTVLTNTGSIAGGASKQINADVSVPVGIVPGPYDVYFRGVSPTTGSTDRIYDSIIVAAQRSIAIVPNGSGQLVAGGTVVFSHSITNTGNVLEGDGAVSNVALAFANSTGQLDRGPLF